MTQKIAFITAAALAMLTACTEVDSDHSARTEPVVASLAKPESAIEPIPADLDPTAQPGTWYRLAVTAGKLEPVPFFAFIPDQGAYAAVRNGDQILVAKLTRKSHGVELRFPIPGTTVTATIAADGTAVTGTWTTVVLEKTITLALSGSRVEAPGPSTRFALDETAADKNPADVSGTWRLDMGELGEAKLSVKQPSPTDVIASVIFPSGNWVHLVGGVRGDTLRLSAFDSTAFYYLRATVKGGKLTGQWNAGPDLSTHDAFVGVHAGDDFQVKRLIGAVDDHLRIPELAQTRYEGKPVIVEMSGTWCANCTYATEALIDLYKKHHKEGLEVITLLYEFTDDEAYNAKQAEKFAAGYGIPWQVIPVTGGAEKASEIVPPGLTGLDTSGFPVAIFVNPDASIAGIHAGFPSPEMSAYGSQVKAYEKLASAILNHGAS